MSILDGLDPVDPALIEPFLTKMREKVIPDGDYAELDGWHVTTYSCKRQAALLFIVLGGMTGFGMGPASAYSFCPTLSCTPTRGEDGERPCGSCAAVGKSLSLNTRTSASPALRSASLIPPSSFNETPSPTTTPQYVSISGTRSQRAFRKTESSITANAKGSVPRPYVTISYLVPANGRNAAVRSSCCFWDNWRGANLALSFAVSNSAIAARSVAIEAFSCAYPASNSSWATRSSDLRLNSPSLACPMRANMTSPATPNAITAPAITFPQRSKTEPYGGLAHAMKTSATTAAPTRPPQRHPHRSQDSDDASNSVSLAFITPFLRNHAGKGFRGFWEGLGAGTLMFAILFVAYSLTKS